MSTLVFEIDGIGHFISDNDLRVPIYQRPYSWEESHIKDIFEDMKNSFPNEYFLGTIVVEKKNNYYEVIDGQQRLATLTIFYASVRNYLLELSVEQDAGIIERDYLCKPVLRSNDPHRKLELGSDDNEFFKNYIIQRPSGNSVKPDKSSHERIEQAYKIASQFVRNEYASFSNQLSRLIDLIDFIKDKVKIIIVKVPDEGNAFTIFETLNDRGLKLSQVDLIKNYLFNKSGAQLPEAKDKWARYTGAIESAATEEQILEYIRYHWSSKNGLTREKELFDAIRAKIKNQNQVITYLNELEIDVNSYLALLNPNHAFWGEYSSNCKEMVGTLLELQLYQNRPLLLAIVKRFTPKDVEKALKLIVSWSVRNLVTGTSGTGTLEKEFSNQAKLINEGKTKSVLDFKDSISKLIPTDDSFTKQFKILTISKDYIARYYLSELEKTYHGTKELETSKNVEKVNLEHILPERADLKKDWNNFNEDQHKTYLKRIGNLTLMDKKMNSDEKRLPFLSKKSCYKKSDVFITKAIAKNKEWTVGKLEIRQMDFAERAVKIWNLKI